MLAWVKNDTMNRFMGQIASGELSPSQQHMLIQRYIPLLQGQRATAWQLAWDDWIYQRAVALKSPKIQKLLEVIPGGKKMGDWMYNGLMAPQGPSLGWKASNYFYLSTLGFNVSPAFNNLFQNILTASVVEPKYMATGADKVRRGVGEYVRLRWGGRGPKLTDAEAMAKAFPEFVDAGVSAGVVSDDALQAELASFPGTSVWERTQKAALGMFTASERFNRLIAFYGGKAKAIGDKIPVELAMKHGFLHPDGAPKIGWIREGNMVRMNEEMATAWGKTLTDVTQMPAGIAGRPYALLTVPPLFRQFMQFPLRYVEFLTQSTKFGGSNFNPGTIGRIGATSAALYEVGKSMGMDLQQSLITGPMPLPSDRGAFAPFPLVPPVLSAVGNLALYSGSGDEKYLEKGLPLTVPFGTAMNRILPEVKSLATGGISGMERGPGWGPPMADGRIPFYDKDGKLVSTHTKTEQIMRLVGLKPLEPQKEYGMVQYLIGQRDNIREFRQRWLRASVENDWSGQMEVEQEYKKKYPELGELGMKKSDMKTIENWKEATRTERVLNQLPKEYRDEFQHMAQLAAPGAFINAANRQELGSRLPNPVNQPENLVPTPQEGLRPFGALESQAGLEDMGEQNTPNSFGNF